MIIDRPRGMVPRARGCGLGPEYAEIAVNLQTLEGRFEPWREPVRVIGFDKRVCAAHVRNCCWSATAVPHSRYVDAGVPSKTYLSGPSERPVVTDDFCAADWTYLGYPVPGDPVVHPDMGADKGPDTQLRTYRISYGTECEEGPASCPSNAVPVNKGQTVRVELPLPPDCMWGATEVNIYRSESLWDSESGLLSFNPNEIDGGWHSSATEADYFLVATLPIGASQWFDTEHTETDRLLTTQDLFPPPEGLQVVGETEAGSLVGFTDCEVLFSERNQYWGFPYKTSHTFPDPIMDVQVVNNTVFVLTCTRPYIIQDDAECADSTARSVLPVFEDLPCVSPLSSLVVGDDIVYSSQKALILLRSNGSYSKCSYRAFGKDEWRTLDPSRIRLGRACDHLLITVPGECTYVWVLSFDESGYLPEDVTVLSFAPDQWLHDEKGKPYFLMNSQAFAFNEGEYMRMHWRQVEQRSTSRETVSAIRGEYVKKKVVDFNTLSVYKEGTLSAVRKLTPQGSKIRGSKSYCTQLDLQGNEPMCWIGAGAGLNDIQRRLQ